MQANERPTEHEQVNNPMQEWESEWVKYSKLYKHASK